MRYDEITLPASEALEGGRCEKTLTTEFKMPSHGGIEVDEDSALRSTSCDTRHDMKPNP